MDSNNTYYGNSTSSVTALDLYACRVCLATDIKLFHIHECGLAEIFAAIISEIVPINDGFPQHLCYYCVALVHKFAAFKSKCKRSHDILQTALLLHQPITTDYLRIIDREAANLNLLLPIRDAVMIDEFIEEDVEAAKEDIKEEVTYDEEHLEIEEEVAVLPTSTNILSNYELPSGITCENNDGGLNLEAEWDNDGSAMSTDHIKCEDQEDVMPLSTICSRNNVWKESKLEANCDADFADDVTGESKAEDGEVNVRVKIEDVRSLNVSEYTEKSFGTFEGADVGKPQNNEKAADAIETTENVKQIYQCDICNKSLKCKASIIVHLKSHQLNSYKPIKIKKLKEGVTREMKLLKKNKHILTPGDPSPTKLSQRTIKRKRHQCDQCPYNTTHMSHFKDHIKIHTGEKPYNCDFCSYKTKKQSHLIVHTRIHTGEKPFTCTVCSYKTGRKGDLIAHSKIHTREEAFTCDVCSYKSRTKNNFLKHARTHTGEKPYTCEFCSYKSRQQSHLIIHTRIHTGEKPFTCDVCNYKTRCKSNLIAHTKIHTGEKPFTCEFCSYKSKRQSHIITHTRIHTGEKPFTCDICSFKTGFKSVLIVHTRTHMGEKPFSCDFCSYKSTNKSDLVKHTKKKH